MPEKLTNVRPELGGPGPLNVLPLILEPDPARTVVRPFDFAYPAAFAEDLGSRRLAVAQRVLGLDEAEQVRVVDRMLAEMRRRHRNVEATFLRRYEAPSNIFPASLTGSPQISSPSSSVLF